MDAISEISADGGEDDDEHEQTAELLEELFTEVRVCKQCNKLYQEIDSRGSWKCSYHPGYELNTLEDVNVMLRALWGYDKRDSVQVWSCCGQPIDARHRNYKLRWRYGCTPQDHTILDRRYDEQDSILTVDPLSITSNKKSWLRFNDSWIVLRYDKKQADYRNEFNTYDKTAAETTALPGEYSMLSNDTAVNREHTSVNRTTATNSNNSNDELWFNDDIVPVITTTSTGSSLFPSVESTTSENRVTERDIQEPFTTGFQSKYPTANAHLMQYYY